MESVEPTECDTPGQLVDLVRDYYLKRFGEAVIVETKSGLSAQAEQPVLEENGFLALEGKLNLPLRLDLVLLDDGEVKDVLRIETEGMLSFEPVEFDWPGGLATRITPFRWEMCRVSVGGLQSPTAWQPLKSWFNKWFDPEERNEPDANGFLQVVHFLSDPEWSENTAVFEVDFGSAPTKSFETLLDALRECGATAVEIGELPRPE